MRKHGKQFLKRAAAAMLGLGLALSPVLSALPPLTAYAAPAGEQAAGTVRIQLMDSSAYGADKNAQLTSTSNNAVSSGSQMKGWGDIWGNLKYSDFLQTPEGMATFESRKLTVFDLGEGTNLKDALDKGHHESQPEYWKNGAWTGGEGQCYTGGDDYAGAYVSQFCLTSHFDDAKKEMTFNTIYDSAGHAFLESSGPFTNGYWYVITADHDKAYSEIPPTKGPGYGYLANTERSDGEQPSDRESWELIFKWADNAKVCVYVDENGEWKSEGNGATIDAKDQPMHNEPARSGFSFRYADIESKDAVAEDGTLKSQGPGNITDVVFGVFNISSDAVGLDGVKADTDGERSNAYGYVTVDENDDEMIDENEAKTFYPAYTYNTVISAYEAYLKEGGVEYYNGMFGEKTGYKNDDSEGRFSLNGHVANSSIVPCLILRDDGQNGDTKAGDGVIDTPCRALPAGNYLVLQLKSGTGYYIDEAFRPIVSIGGYFASKPIYRDQYISDLGYGLNDGTTKFKDAPGNSPVILVSSQTGEHNHGDHQYSTAYPMYLDGEYVESDGQTKFNYDGVTETLYPNGLWYQVNPNGQTNTPNKQDLSDAYTNKGVGARRVPGAGMSRLIAWQTPVRSGAAFFIGDNDDIVANTANTSIYVSGPQGDGSFDGTVYRLYNDIDLTDPDNSAAKNALKADENYTYDGKHYAIFHIDGEENKVLPNDGSKTPYIDLTVEQDAQGNAWINIPADGLPYGVYSVVQVRTGEGYGYDDVDGGETGGADRDSGKDGDTYDAIKAGEATRVARIMVTMVNGAGENVPAESYTYKDESQKDTTKELYTAGQNHYTPQTIVRGGKKVTAGFDTTIPEDVKSDIEVQVKIYNISAHYVYVDQDGNGELETTDKIPTSGQTFNSSIRGSLSNQKTPADMKKLLSSIDKSCVWDSGMVKISELADGVLTDTWYDLPYGTYLAAVVGISGNYGISGPLFAEGKVTGSDPDDEAADTGGKPADGGDQFEFEFTVTDPAYKPAISTELLYDDYRIDSVPEETGVTIVDEVQLENLGNGVEYTLYGMLCDESGAQVSGTGVVTQTVSGVVDTGHGAIDSSTATSIAELVRQGAAFAKLSAREQVGYAEWLALIDTNIGHLHDSVLDTAVDEAEAERTATNGIADVKYQRLMQRLNWLNSEGKSGDSLSGTAAAEMKFENVDGKALAGKKLTAIMYLAEGTELIPEAVNATDLSQLRLAMSGKYEADATSLLDENETVHVAQLSVTAEGSVSGGHGVDHTEDVEAHVSGGGLEAGNSYHVHLQLLDENGDEVPGAEADLTVMPDSKGNFTADHVFDGLDFEKYGGQRLSVQADLYRTEDGVDRHLSQAGDPASVTAPDGTEGTEPEENQVDLYNATVRTVLSGTENAKEVQFADGKAELADTVTYSGLIPGAEYESVLHLYTDNGGELNGFAPVVQKFKAENPDANGNYVVTLASGVVTLPNDFMSGGKIVAFNDLYRLDANGKRIGTETTVSEHDTTSADQTITAVIPEKPAVSIVTELTGPDGAKTVNFDKPAVLTDKVNYENLEPETKYVSEMEIHDESGAKIGDAVQLAFTSDKDGKAEVTLSMTVTLSKTLDGKKVYAYNWVYPEGSSRANGASETRADSGYDTTKQSVTAAFTTIGVTTTLTGPNNAKTNIDFDSGSTLTDKVEYTGLDPEKEYESVLKLAFHTLSDNYKGVLFSEGSVGNGQVATMRQRVKPDASGNGTATLTTGVFTLPSGWLATGDEIIAFNYLYEIDESGKRSTAPVASEEDFTNALQTVTVHVTPTTPAGPYISTEALDTQSNTHFAAGTGSISVTDTVTIRNLVPKAKYTLVTELANAVTGRTLDSVKARSTSFTASEEGTYKTTISLSTSSESLAGQAVVVYESLYDSEGIDLITSHRDKDDTDQTVWIAGIDTIATSEDGRSKSLAPARTRNTDTAVSVDPNTGSVDRTDSTTYSYVAMLRDQVIYENLQPGNAYDIETKVVNVGGGGEVGSSTRRYIPSSSDGVITVTLQIDVTKSLGKEVVVYETIKDAEDGTQIAVHQDSADKDQTVRILIPDGMSSGDGAGSGDGTAAGDNTGKPENTGKDIQTGVAERYGLYIGIAAVLALCAGGCFIWYKKRRK